MLLFSALIILLILTVLPFELWMFVDAVRNPALGQDRRLLWLLGMLLVHPFVAIAYFLTDRQR